MSTKTTHLELVKPSPNDFYSVEVFNANADKIDSTIGSLTKDISTLDSDVTKLQTDIQSCFRLSGDGKKKIADAITGKGITTSATATYDTMAANIKKIQTGVDTSDANATSSTIIEGYTAYVKGVKVKGSARNTKYATGTFSVGVNIKNSNVDYCSTSDMIWKNANVAGAKVTLPFMANVVKLYFQVGTTNVYFDCVINSTAKYLMWNCVDNGNVQYMSCFHDKSPILSNNVLNVPLFVIDGRISKIQYYAYA